MEDIERIDLDAVESPAQVSPILINAADAFQESASELGVSGLIWSMIAHELEQAAAKIDMLVKNWENET